MILKMRTQEKASELVQDLGLNHAIYVTEEIITILKDWEGTELAQKDWFDDFLHHRNNISYHKER